MEEAAADLDAVWGLPLQGLSSGDELELFIRHVGAGHSGLVVELLEVLDRLPLERVKVPLLCGHDSLVRLLEQLAHRLPIEQVPRRVDLVWSLLAVAGEQCLSERELLAAIFFELPH